MQKKSIVHGGLWRVKVKVEGGGQGWREEGRKAEGAEGGGKEEKGGEGTITLRHNAPPSSYIFTM